MKIEVIVIAVRGRHFTPDGPAIHVQKKMDHRVMGVLKNAVLPNGYAR